MADKSATSVISLPKGGGAIKGIGETFQPNLFTGTGNFSIPIATSPGRAGFGPQLTLQYSTGNGNGPFGLGWQLSIPRITRKTEKGLPKYDDSDVFVMSGAEDLVPCLKEIDDPDHPGQKKWVAADSILRGNDTVKYTVTRYRPRTEGLFARIEKWVKDGDVHWRATTKNNVTSVYGRTKEARVLDPDNEDHIYEWLLQETFDAKGNHTLYEYARDDPKLDLQRINEANRTYCQTYIRRIYYGNLPNPLVDKDSNPVTYENGDAIGHEREGTDHGNLTNQIKRRYAFELVFDYGDWNHPPYKAIADRTIAEKTSVGKHPDPVSIGQQEFFGPDPSESSAGNAVPVRADPFSSFRAGFETRTLRTCRRVLMFHHFRELGGPTLVRSTDLEYEQNPDTHVSFLARAAVTGYRKAGNEYIQTTMPPVTFKYSKFKPHEQHYQPVSARGNEMPPLALNNPDLTLVDLSGNGLPDVLHTSPDGFRYWKNLGNGLLDRPQRMSQVPAGITLSQPGVGFADLAGDGRADLLVLSGPLKGFFETTPDGTWNTFKPFVSLPSFDLADPNVRLVDLTGDGLTDILMTREHRSLWFECLGEEGYAEPQSVERAKFPDVYFDDPSGRVRLADMTGDGLNDIVLVHNGRIDYWPNLGYGRFGKRITMAESPRLEYDFNPSRLFLSDLDGSGCADLVYVDYDRTYFWFNRSGNSWSDEQVIRGTPAVADNTAIQFVDFFGTGTTAVVWSYDYNRQPGGNYKVLDFCGGVKPYLLTEMSNNMGATTRVHYGSSTQHYLRDEANGEPWATQLPFPVQVVDKVEVIDHISKTKLVTTYKYHHGYFDGREREFRGFGRVDQFDTESFDDFIQAGLHDGDGLFENKTRAYHVPPVETRTWFHTGIYFEQDPPSGGSGPFDYRELTNGYRKEFYDGDEKAFQLADHQVETGDTPHEAYRALRGAALRTEVYARDGTDKAEHPYTVTQNRHWVNRLQPRDGNNHAVYLTIRKESLTYHYERNPGDPRVGHDIALDIDDLGNVTDSVSIGYPRRVIPPKLLEQGELEIVYTKSDFINKADDPQLYYVGVACQSRKYETTGIIWAWTDPPQPLRSADFATVTADPESFVPFEQQCLGNPPAQTKRIIEWTRSYFRKDKAADDLDDSGALACRLNLREIESLGLPYESYQAVLTNGLVKSIYGDYPPGTLRVTNEMLKEAGYHHESDVTDFLWVPSGRQSFKRDGFYLPTKTRDPFGNVSSMTYDDYCLLIETATDPLENTVQARNDYRVLQPDLLTDPNGNYSMVAFDALGLVVGTAVLSRDKQYGDSFVKFEPDLSESQIKDYFTQPRDCDTALLGTATTRIIYDLWSYQRSANQGLKTVAPPVAATLAREKHVSDLGDGETSPIQHSLLYSDGFGRQVQVKVQAEPGEVDGKPVKRRWVGTGAKVYNNKGKPVRQFEPFFSDTHEFGIEQHGISPIIFYDPLERVVCTVQPNHTYEKVVLDSWQQETWDVNDTAGLEDPKTDQNVGAFFALLAPGDYLPTWYTRRKDGGLDAADKDAARKTATHANTPTLAHLDMLGRVFLTVADNGAEGKYKTHVKLDIQGNDRIITDPRGVAAFQHNVDMLGHKLGINGVDSGHRRVLLAVDEQPTVTWDVKGNRVRVTYDKLRRPIQTWVDRGKPHNDTILNQAVLYGERLATHTNLDAPLTGNHRGRVYATLDGAGVVFNRAYDFKGNLCESVRRLTTKYREDIDWQSFDFSKPVSELKQELYASTLLEQEVFCTTSSFDALNRVTESTAPDHTSVAPDAPLPKDGSVYRFTYNEANLLDKAQVNLRSDPFASSPSRTLTPFVKNINYNAKGQRERIEYGNGVVTEYTYDPLTFRLQTMVSKKGDGTVLQDLRYTYDPVGNITQIHDGAFERVFNHNRRVDPTSRYEYDPVYRLVEAQGREHEGMTACHHLHGNKKQTEFIPLDLTQPINNGQALRNYTEHYAYDASGNLLQIRHVARPSGSWTRNQEYEVDNPALPPDQQRPVSNRLYKSDAGCPGEDTFTYIHDANGNITKMPYLQALIWDYAGQLRQVTMNTVTKGTNDRVYYVYDATGRRVRKVIERGSERKEERIYLGDFEVHRGYNGTGLTLERQTLHVMDDQRRIALVETRTVGKEPNQPARRFRYQLDNHLGSSLLEVDEQAREISYEEYYPYGGTSYLAGGNETEVKRKRYRYTGKERDDETGLYYYGARYYSPWLCRWTSCDPAGIADGSNLYTYSKCNPVTLVDPTGMESGRRDSNMNPLLTWDGNGITLGNPQQPYTLQFAFSEKANDNRTYPDPHESFPGPASQPMNPEEPKDKSGEIRHFDSPKLKHSDSLKSSLQFGNEMKASLIYESMSTYGSFFAKSQYQLAPHQPRLQWLHLVEGFRIDSTTTIGVQGTLPKFLGSLSFSLAAGWTNTYAFGRLSPVERQRVGFLELCIGLACFRYSNDHLYLQPLPLFPMGGGTDQGNTASAEATFRLAMPLGDIVLREVGLHMHLATGIPNRNSVQTIGGRTCYANVAFPEVEIGRISVSALLEHKSGWSVRVGLGIDAGVIGDRIQNHWVHFPAGIPGFLKTSYARPFFMIELQQPF